MGSTEYPELSGSSGRVTGEQRGRAVAERSEREKMLAGELYRASDPELVALAARAERLLRAFNATDADESERRAALLGELLGSVGADAVVPPPFYCDYGANVHPGRGTFLNYNCVLLDVCRIEVGALCQIGPDVQIYAADHPRDPALRRQGLESGKPVRIGSNGWIGGAAIILAGITIGDDAVIGAGSVVTRDVAAGVTVAGNPARPLGHAAAG
jgi:maltose O-acetyltransferase